MTGQNLLSLAQPHLGEKYVLGVIAPKDVATYHGPWDCAEFTSWLVYQLTSQLYGCANNAGEPSGADAYSGFWARDAERLGTKITLEQAVRTPGACILRLAGKGLIGHIVVSDGKGGTIEAHSSKTGVIRNKITGRRWDYGVLVPWIDYTMLAKQKEPVKTPATMIYRWTDPIMPKSEKVKEIQRVLKMKPADIDGWFGAKTFAAVKRFQSTWGLVPDGEVGPQTALKLGISI